MLYLNEQVYCCESEDGAIFLDLRMGCYLSVAASDLPCLKAHVANWPNSMPSDSCSASQQLAQHLDAASSGIVHELRKRGLLTEHATPVKPSIDIRPLKSVALTGRQMHERMPAFRFAIPFLITFIQVRWRLKSGNLERLVHNLKTKHPYGLGPSRAARVERLLSAYSRLQVWVFTAQDHCLLDSLVLSQFLRRLQMPCTFVIGVTTKPFLAHAWVQVGDTVLNDSAEHAQQFEPILAIGE
jgi:Transglutaminase-like superfamily